MTFLARLWPTPDPETVVREYGPEVYRRLKRIFGPHVDIDDVYQNVFVEIIRSLPNYRGQARLSAWIKRITWNIAYQEMRMQYQIRPHEMLSDSDMELPGLPLEEALEARDTLQRFYKVIADLDPKIRVVLLLHDVEGCKLREIAETMGRPLATVASQLAVARARLAQQLAAQQALELTGQTPSPITTPYLSQAGEKVVPLSYSRPKQGVKP